VDVGSVAGISELYTTAIFMVKVSKFLFEQNYGGKGVGSCPFRVIGSSRQEKVGCEMASL
jgi:hypothetical protein